MLADSWEMNQIKDVCQLGRGRVINQNELYAHPGQYPVYSSQSKDGGSFGYLDTFDFEGEYVTWTTDGAYAGTVFYRSGHFNCTNVCGTLKAKTSQICMKYLAYALSTKTKKHVSYVGNPKLMNNVMGDIVIPFPHLQEQRRIAEILDTIDEAIQKTEALISKLKAIKQGLLHDLLTLGLDKNGKLRDPKAHPEQFKDSPLLGTAPLSWRIQKLQNFYDEPSLNGLYKPKKYYGHGPLMIHMPQMFRGLIIDTSDAARVEVNSAEINRYGLRNGDLVFARRSLNLEGAGRCALVDNLTETTTFESSIIRVRIRRKELLPKFLNYFLNSAIGFILRLPLIRQVAVSGVSSGDIASIPIPCPSIGEQERIIQVIEAHVSRVRNEEQYRNKLKLQKKGLMHDLLTGKVRVKV